MSRPAQIKWRHIILLWMLAAAAWTPAAHLAREPGSHTLSALARIFLQMLLHFAPWAISAPLFLGLSRRFPIGLGRTTPHTLLFALLGLIVIPLFTTTGVVVARLMNALLFGVKYGWALDNLANAVVITSLFALPTYVALVAIGQTIAYFDRYRQRERLLSHARAEALRSQIAPHFLFNALNAISALGYKDPGRADRAIVKLARLLRQTLDRPAQVSVADEVAMVADYVELHRLLLGERLNFELKVGPEVWQARIPAMLIQPLIENAIIHGLSPLPEGGTLSLVIAVEGSALVVETINDAPSDTPSSPGGIGLANVRQRLAATYGDRAYLSFERGSSSARAVARLPLKATKL